MKGYMIQIGRVIGATSGYIENTQSNAHLCALSKEDTLNRVLTIDNMLSV